MNDHLAISFRVTSNNYIKPDIVSVIWYGSSSRGMDLHHRSDCDLQIILAKPNIKAIHELGKILEDYPHVDISIIYLSDIIGKDGKIIFQSGTKGSFFVYILAKGKVLYGKNIYEDILIKLDRQSVSDSIVFTSREYLSKLRIMATRSPLDTLNFKKYSLKLFKDILVLDNLVDLEDLHNCSYEDAAKFMKNNHTFSNKSSKALTYLCNFNHNYSKEDMAYLLYDYENIVNEIIYEKLNK